MADQREIVITIKNGDSKPTPDPKPDDNPKPTEPDVLKKLKKAVDVTAGIVHLSQIATYSYGQYTRLTENYISQNNINAAKQIIGKTAAIGTAIFTGNYIAAATAIIGTGINIATNYINAFEDLDQKAYNKYYYGARYGLINGNRGTDN